MKTHPHPTKSGQVLIFMALVLVMATFAALFYFDAHKILHVKGVSRNAGDAAALAGARWQAITLNLIGNLNVAQALAITESVAAGQTDSPEARLIADLQRRLAFSGPLFAYLASQQAAKNNGIHNQDSFRDMLLAHADRVEREYDDFYDPPFVPMAPMTSPWLEYADMLRFLGEEGIAVGAENWRFFQTYADNSHMLLTPAFYEAIAGRSWCWFYHGPYDLLVSYNSFRDWDPLPAIETSPPINSELFSLMLSRVQVLDRIPFPSGLGGADSFIDLFERLSGATVSNEVLEFEADWAFYNPGAWSDWSSHIPEGFPWDGEIREQFDYFGADAAVRVRAETERHTNFQGGDTVNWTAAAKPFGTLEGDVRPTSYGIVLPAFTDVRLIPIDTSSGGGGGVREGWLEFITVWLPRYMEFGPMILPESNWYAQQLIQWERLHFRAEGIAWLRDNSATCTYDPPPGPGPGGHSSGGTYRGH